MNNKGMAITTVIYSIILLLSLCMFLVLGILRSEYTNDKQYITDLRDELNDWLKGDEVSTGADKLVSKTGNKDNSGLYTIVHPADSTLQIGTNEDITEYRYRGANPKNYVTFNNETWRIIGVFPVDDGNGNIENRIKIIRNESIGDKYWNTEEVSSTSSYNNWTGATLNTYLNGTYLTGLSSETQSMIGNAKYYLGGCKSSQNIQKDVMYQYERKISGSDYYYGTNPNSWIGKLALMYASDYGYAASDECTQTLHNYNNSTCKENNWLYNIKVNEWTLPQVNSDSSLAFSIISIGGVGNFMRYVYGDLLAVRPVLYLTSSAKITGGSGTLSSPYTFGL